MLRRLPFLVVLLRSILPAQATIPIDTEAVAASVVFIYAAKPNGEVDATKAVATGFFVSVPLKSNAAMSYILLATARHVVNPEWANCGWSNPDVVYLRLNKKNYRPSGDATGIGYVKLVLRRNGRALFTAPSDSQIDAAIILLTTPMLAMLQSYQFAAVPISLFVTPEEANGLGVGDQIVTAGLVPGVPGANRNYSFFKFGHISLIPNEAVQAGCSSTSDPPHWDRVWFIAANLVPGNSGAPVFCVPLGTGGARIGGGAVNRPMLVGIQSISIVPADLAGMTPIEPVFDMITGLKLLDADLYRGDPDRRPKERAP